MACAGGLSQDQRLEAMSKLKQYQCRVLISTDLVRHAHLSVPLSIWHASPEFLSLSLSLNVFVHFIYSAFSSVSDFQRYRCRESQLGDKPGCATGLGNLHAPNWTCWPLWLVSSITWLKQKQSQTNISRVVKYSKFSPSCSPGG